MGLGGSASAVCRVHPAPRLLPLLAGVFGRIAAVAAVLTALLAAAFFPWSSDAPLSAAEQTALRAYYATAYARPAAGAAPDEDSLYVRTARQAAENQDIAGQITRFTRQYGLADGAVLDVGAGRGYLQDVIDNYTALDISPSAGRYFHKRFVVGSATLMPFAASEFDAAWTVWVLEHVPNPEAALAEMRRVLRDGGLLFLLPAWDCTPWAAPGYPVRPYGDFGPWGKLVKATIPLQFSLWMLAREPVRLARLAAWQAAGGGPTRLRYRRLTPNYDQYWMPDSDAINSLSRHETALWFRSRGDECLNCEDAAGGALALDGPLIIRVHKRAG